VGVVLVTTGLLVACGGGSSGPAASAPASTAMLPPAPEPATAPVPTRTPAGRIVPVGSLVEGIVADGPTNTVAAALRDRRLALLDARTGRVRATVNANGSARHLRLAKPGGPVLVPGEDTDLLTQIRLPDGVIVATARVGRQPHDADDDPRTGRVVVADELGGAVSFVDGDRSVAQLPGPVQPGGLVVTGGRAAAVDVRGNAVFVYDVAAATQIARVPMGAGLTHAVALDDDRIVVADTRGNALFVVALSGIPRILGRIDFPEGSPYGMAVDGQGKRLYVAASGANLLVPFDVGTGATLTRSGTAIPTLQQPNSLAVDPRDGTVFVGGATTAGAVEIIPPTG
jgi:DNA-binding beta-propeller fold protein YncE